MSGKHPKIRDYREMKAMWPAIVKQVHKKTFLQIVNKDPPPTAEQLANTMVYLPEDLKKEFNDLTSVKSVLEKKT